MSQPRYNQILYAVGSGLHSWSIVEIDLAHLFAALAKSNPHELFGAIISFETRLAITDRLMSLNPLEELEREMWTKLSARLSKFYKKRHELAHFTLGQKDERDVIYPFLTTANMRQPGKPCLDESQIQERIDRFMELSAALEWFSKIVVRRRMPLEAVRLTPLEEPPLVARLRELATLSLEERQRRDQEPLAKGG